MAQPEKGIFKRLEKICSICGRKIKVILCKDKAYRGGHYFGKIPLCTLNYEIPKIFKMV